jgi:flagellar motor switch protein FliM
MSNNPSNPHSSLDRALLAKLTGDVGDRATLVKLSSTLAQVYAALLPDLVRIESGLDVTVTYADCKSGLMADLVSDLAQHFAVANGSLQDWSDRVVLACGSRFVITLMEHMLGAAPETIEDPALRSLSVIELDLAATVLEKLASVLKSGVAPAGTVAPRLGLPHNIEELLRQELDYPDEFAVAVRMQVALGVVTSDLVLILPQRSFLKTRITVPKTKSQSSTSDAWAQQIGEQVRRSQVTLEARIRLQSLTLGTISRLAAGDVVPFMDKGDVNVAVSANGKDLYMCDFGRSGENYTVRVKDNTNSEDELLRHLMK